MPLSDAQKAYLAGPPPSDPGIEELVRLGHSEEVFTWPTYGELTWREHARFELEAQYRFTGKWLDGPQVHYLLERLPLKPTFRVRLEESVLWLQAWTQPVGIGGGFQPGTRIVVLPPTTQTETTLHEAVGHVTYADWMYQRRDLQKAFMAALRRYADWGNRYQGDWPEGTFRVWELVEGFIEGGWQENGSWFDGFVEPWNPDEAFASTLSACKGNLALLPPFIADFYRGAVDG